MEANRRIDNYSIMITSKYFECINDYINLEIAVKRFNGNMERFRFNPISLNDKTRKFFTNLETLHLYGTKDQIFEDGRIFKQCIQYKVNYDRYIIEKDKGNDCKCVCYKRDERLNNGYEIPDNVKILGEYCFSCCKLKSLEIPISVVELADCCFEDSFALSEITIPYSVTRLGRDCFHNCHLLQSIKLPDSISSLNDYCFANCSFLSSITIPSSVLLLGPYCFSGCLSIDSLVIPSSVVSIGEFCFSFCLKLQSITIPSSVSFIGDNCCRNCTSLTSFFSPFTKKKTKKTWFTNCSSLNHSNIYYLENKCKIV